MPPRRELMNGGRSLGCLERLPVSQQRVRVDGESAAPFARRFRLQDGEVQVEISRAGVARVSHVTDDFSPLQGFTLLEPVGVTRQVSVVKIVEAGSIELVESNSAFVALKEFGYRPVRRREYRGVLRRHYIERF